MRCAASCTDAPSRRHTGSAGASTATVSWNTAGPMECSSGSPMLEYSSSAACSCIAPPSRANPSVLFAAELLRVAHVRPRPRLGIPEDLLDVVAVVVDPFLEEIFHAQPADLGMLAAPGEIAGLEPAHEGHALRAHALELRHELGSGLHVVAPPSGHLVLVPALELGILGGEEILDPPREAAPLGLDQVPDDLVDRPLGLVRMEGGHHLG